MYRVIAFSSLLPAIWLSTQGESSADEEESINSVPPIVVELSLSEASFDPAAPAGMLTCIIRNASDHDVVVPQGFDSDYTRVSAQAWIGDDPQRPAFRWPLQLYCRGRPGNAIQTTKLSPGEKLKIFELPLQEILAARKNRIPFGSTEISPTDTAAAQPAAPLERWGWDWIAHPRPPASPIHTRDGYVDAVQFRVELMIGQARFSSQSKLLKVFKAPVISELIRETKASGEVRLEVTPDGDSSSESRLRPTQ